MRKHIANIITALRICCSAALLCTPTRSAGFWLLYLLCGLSDMADGPVARKTGSCSRFGEKLDSAADLAFIASAAAKLLPGIWLPTWLWIWVTVIALVKIGNIALRRILQQKRVALHYPWNRVTGLLLFLLPLTLSFVETTYSAAAVCAAASIAAVRECCE